MSNIVRRPHSNFVYTGDVPGAQLYGLGNPYVEQAQAEGWTPRLRAQYLYEYASRSGTPSWDSVIQTELDKRKDEPTHPMYDYYSARNFDFATVKSEFNSLLSSSGDSSGGGYQVTTAGVSSNTLLYVVGGAAALGFAYMVMNK